MLEHSFIKTSLWSWGDDYVGKMLAAEAGEHVFNASQHTWNPSTRKQRQKDSPGLIGQTPQQNQ